MKYATYDAMLNCLDRIVKAKVKHYMGDWTEIDRPAFKSHCAVYDRKGNTAIGYDEKAEEWNDSLWLLIARECGTYLLPIHAVYDRETVPSTIYEYYRQDGKRNEFWTIDLNRKEVRKANLAVIDWARKAN